MQMFPFSAVKLQSELQKGIKSVKSCSSDYPKGSFFEGPSPTLKTLEIHQLSVCMCEEYAYIIYNNTCEFR